MLWNISETCVTDALKQSFPLEPPPNMKLMREIFTARRVTEKPEDVPVSESPKLKFTSDWRLLSKDAKQTPSENVRL